MRIDRLSGRRLSAALMMTGIAAMLTLFGCAKEKDLSRQTGKDGSTAGDVAPKPVAPVTVPERPQSKQGTIMLEGMADTIRLDLFDSSPYSFPLPFTTYLPEDMIAEQVPDSIGPAIAFVSNFGGRRNADASMTIFSIPSATSEEEARAVAIRVATRAGRNQRKLGTPTYAWTLAEHGYRSFSRSGKELTGTIALARHGERFFYLQIEYPAEYAEGFAPRARLIFNEWQWSDATSPGIAYGPAPRMDPDADTSSVTATIIRIERPDAGRDLLFNLVLEDRTNRDTSSNRTIVHVASTTRISTETNGSRDSATFTDLKAGQRVRAIYIGAVPAIYPMRVMADELVIIDPEK